MKHQLSDKWIKASIAGTVWAASEIVLGSFLHNLRVPFSGNILTAIGIIILISVSYIWNERGLFWRAGLVCALMKTMSPSAVIFGPMIAIISEAFLLEASVTIIGRNIPGYATGAMLAMSWNLFQKILNYIIFYGSNIIEVYSNLLKMAQKEFSIKTDIVWLPIIFLLVIYALFGLMAAVIGITVGRRMLKQPAYLTEDTRYTKPAVQLSREESRFRYSISWLIADFALIISSFILLNKASWMIWTGYIISVVIIWSLRYKRALRQLMRPRFWVFFGLITLLTAIAFSQAQQGENTLIQGILTGIQMNFRAVVIILGFAALGTELYNPSIRDFFLRTSFRHLHLALELSAETLQGFIANIPDFKSLVRNPISIFYKVISQADARLAEIKRDASSAQKVFIISGAIGTGKTSLTKRLIQVLRENNIRSGGIISERVIAGNERVGYDLVNIETGEKRILLRVGGECGPEHIGRFSICSEGVKLGQNILSTLTADRNKIAVIDEIGPLELENKGWAMNLDKIIHNSENHIIMVVRDTLVGEVKKRWMLDNAITFNIKRCDFQETCDIILKEISSQKDPIGI